MSEQKFPVYSFHTFIFPFLWNNSGKVARAEFEKCLNKRWKLDLFDTTCDQDLIGARLKELYDQYQYFNTPARRAMYTFSDAPNEIVRNYRYDLKASPEDPSAAQILDGDNLYVIEKGDRTYSLNINGLSLKLYSSGIGLLVYELENHNYRGLDEVNKINDYGRRVYCPYIFDVNALTSSFTADRIRLVGNAFCLVQGYNDDRAWNITAEEKGDGKMPRIKLAKIVTILLSNAAFSVTVNAEDSNTHLFYIEPIIDDDMFVACYLKDKAFANSLGEWDGTEYSWLSDALKKEPDAKDNLARMLYEFVFVDSSGISCANRAILRALLEKHVYTRWAEYGTFHGVTEYSMVCVSSADSDYIAQNPFLTQHIELAKLALVQRASLIAFERQISLVSTDRKAEQETMEAFVRFQGQLMLTEVTSKQQGIDLYDMLLEQLYVNKEKDAVENRIRNLFDLKAYKTEKRMNMILFWIAVASLITVFDAILHIIEFLDRLLCT